jgi:hypothetical protein
MRAYTGLWAWAVLGVLAGSAPGGPPGVCDKKAEPPPKRAPIRADSWEGFLSSAVLEGLKADRMPRAVVKKLREGDNFLGKCPLCACVEKAFDDYLRLPKVSEKELGARDWRNQLLSADKGVRHGALRKLVAGYVEAGYQNGKLSKSDREAIRKEIAKHHGAPKDGGFCPSCDGACMIRGKR